MRTMTFYDDSVLTVLIEDMSETNKKSQTEEKVSLEESRLNRKSDKLRDLSVLRAITVKNATFESVS